MTADPTPVPPHLSDAERALWEKAQASEMVRHWPDAEVWLRDGFMSPAADFLAACSPSVIHSLLTALSSERAAGEREKTDAARYHRLRSIALGDDCDAWTAWYFLVDDVMPEGPAMFDKAVDAHTPEPAHD